MDTITGYTQSWIYKVTYGAREKIRQNLDFILKQKPNKIIQSPWFLITLSFVFAFISYQGTIRSHSLDWLKQNTPSLKVWITVLEKAGYSLSTSPLQDNIQNVLPRITSKSPKVWLSIDQNTLIIFTSQDIWIFQNQNADPKTLHYLDWEPIGWGWDALSLLSEKNPPKPLKKLQKKNLLPLDPKELTY